MVLGIDSEKRSYDDDGVPGHVELHSRCHFVLSQPGVPARESHSPHVLKNVRAGDPEMSSEVRELHSCEVIGPEPFELGRA